MLISMTLTSMYKTPLLGAVSAALLAGTLTAQTATPVTTGQTAPTVQAFEIERALTLGSFNTTLTPSIPAATLAGVQSGANEIRESINYSPQAGLLTVNLFTVQTGSPLPTTANVAATTFSTIVIKVDKVDSPVTPNNGLMFAGTVVTSVPASAFGNLVGSPAAVAVGYTSDTPPQVTNAVTLIAGSVVEYSASAGGTLTFVSSPVAPPTTSGAGAPQIVVNAPGGTAFKTITLDASGTISPNTPLTYSWTVLGGTASISNFNTATATASLLGGFGLYTFEVAVTDSKGNTAQQVVNVTYH